MGIWNRNSGYGQAMAIAQASGHRTTGRTFMVASSTESNYNTLADLYKPDPDGTLRLYGSITAALAACTAGRGDVILLSPGFTTAPTLTELATCNTKQVMMEQSGGKLGEAYVTVRPTETLPATTATPLFTVTGPIRMMDIIGEVTTAIQNQLTSVQLAVIPTVGSSNNLHALGGLNIASLDTGGILGITGTLTAVPVMNSSGILATQASPVYVPAGQIKLVTNQTSTGAIKWVIRYQPLLPGSRVFSTI